MIKIRLVLVGFLTVVTLNACNLDKNNKNNKSNNSFVVTPQNDSLLLVYDAKNADKKLDAYFKTIHKTRNFNGNVLIAKNGKIIYQNAFGWADYLHRDSLTINSKFQLASVSKPFTGTVVLELIEQKKLKLNQTVQDFFPDFPYPDITIQMLLSHRSGLVNYVYFTDKIWKHKYEGMSNFDVMHLFAQYKPKPYFPPNRMFHYNNSNFMILAAIVEKVTKKPFAQTMHETLFKPLGMKNTAIYSTTVYEKIPVDVVGHDRNWRRSVRQDFLDGTTGDKGIYSTIGDLYLFDQAIRNGRVLSKTSLDLAYTPHSKLQNKYFGYGLGWRIYTDSLHKQKVIYHTGWWHGFRHIFLRDTKQNITIILLSNLVNGSINQIDDVYKIVGMPVIRRGANPED